MYSTTPSPLQLVVALAALALIFISQRYWLVRAWRAAARVKNPPARIALKVLCAVAFGLFGCAIASNMVFNFAVQHTNLMLRRSLLTAWTGLWTSSALFAYLAVKLVAGIAWLAAWLGVRFMRQRQAAPSHAAAPAGAVGARTGVSATSVSETEITANRAGGAGESAVDRARYSAHCGATGTADDPGRRHFLQTATLVAGAVPFALAGYGFLFERLRYEVQQVDLPIAGLPPRLAGLRIAQLSDIHTGAYMSGADVRRAVAMTNELGADMIAATGDFVTGINDPLETCIAELSRLRAPLGVWGCNGNHEIYAGVEGRAAQLFTRYGMRLLRQQSAELNWHGQAFNLIGVDYQRQRRAGKDFRPMLSTIEPLVRRDVPNILLSHNPNSFPRAAELGIEAMLTGHTHGGQVRIEILDRQFSPARFLTPYVAGMYHRPMGAHASLEDRAAWASSSARGAAAAAVVYVNRGLGTIAAPVRLGVPPEITLHTLRCA